MEKSLVEGQESLKFGNMILIIFVVIVWSSNSVIVKITVSDIPPIWAAFLRFAPTLPFIYLFIRRFGAGINISLREFFRIFMLSWIMFFQIFLFNMGSQYTTGGRTTLIIFSFPLVVSLIAPIFIEKESFSRLSVIGSLISIAGLFTALHNNITGTLPSTFKGDLIEIVSCFLLALNVVYNKHLCITINKWKVLFWEFVLISVLFAIAAGLFEELPVSRIRAAAWIAVAYQSIGVSIFCFLGWQYILAKHNSSKVSVFFFIGPLSGMVLGILILKEAFNPWLMVGCILVGSGIYLVNKQQN